MACTPYYNTCTARHATKNAPSFPRPPAPPQAPRAKEPQPHKMAVAPEPSKKRVAPGTGLEEWTETADSLYSVSPPPSSVPMPTSLLLTVTPPTACAVDVGATDELRRILKL
ncbi:hypothetical protein Zm00014a_023909 [Zea mays]|jgi:hypothetical protein|uniref:Uncharacterized protein n=2 Tax=Zea mays TaxID=4577 RepID=B4FEW3_MAIZE|nr:uncharacterized protein LOC100193400 [Zea mays]ACF80656.1 unknown [Zea mays]ACG47830.1 hypothetical protein [Zea mays]ONM61281.1 hypothetical protein ZEAMMB73_Zm00001d022624 [Zea mays]PWZ14022.1 hypothetical protein Zm00014a_023909 [Zea mays]|eukprot:NP_001131997.1 uncharacterized protein LOC100193400 [Zea mays]